MKISFRAIGKTHDPQLRMSIDDFTGRIRHYFPIEWTLIPAPKITSQAELMKAEAELILQTLKPGDYLIALDEHGKQTDSPQLASLIEKQSFQSTRNLVFVIGGAFGFHQTILDKADFVWSLSKLTFPHQLVRLILAEQVYRACTIIRHEKYHHS